MIDVMQACLRINTHLESLDAKGRRMVIESLAHHWAEQDQWIVDHEPEPPKPEPKPVTPGPELEVNDRKEPFEPFDLPDIKNMKRASLKPLLQFLVIKMGTEGERWRYDTVTSPKLARWAGWTVQQAKQRLDFLVEKGYAVKEGREHRSQRTEHFGGTAVTYGLISDRVKKFLML